MKYRFLICTSVFFSVFSVHCSHAQVFSTNSSDNVPISYEVHGAGTPVLVFVHGWSCDRRYWREQMAELSKKFKTVAIDLAGHGTSGLARKNYTIDLFAADVVAVVNQLGGERVVLVGHSMGGDIVATAARLLPPDRIAGIVMADSYKELGPGRTPEQVAGFLEPLRHHFAFSMRKLVPKMFAVNADRALVEWVSADMASAPPPIAISTGESALNYSRQITNVLAGIKLPVVAMNPDDNPTNTESMKQYSVEVIIVPGVGHFMMMENPKLFNESLENIVSRLIKG